MTTTITLNEQQTKLLIDVLADAPQAWENELERRLEINYYDDNETLAWDHQRLVDLKQFSKELTDQIIYGPKEKN